MSTAKPNSSLPLTRALLAITFLFAAILKSRELYLWGSTTIDLAAILVESILAIWLIAGFRLREARFATLGWLAIIFCVSLYRFVKGETSCGCFGEVRTHPALTLGIDAAGIIAMAFRKKWLVVPAQMALAGMLGSVLFSAGLQIARPGEASLDPYAWIGRPFPLARYIDRWPEMEKGKWVVVLHSPYCRICNVTTPEYEDLAREWKSYPGKPHVAMIDTSGFASGESTGDNDAIHGKLNAPSGWTLQLPTIVLISDGRVTSVCQDHTSCAGAIEQFIQSSSKWSGK